MATRVFYCAISILFLVGALLSLSALAFGAGNTGDAVTMGGFGHRVVPKGTKGDTWDGAWLTNDKFYLQYDDGNGFLKGKRVSHDGISELLGTPEDVSSISGVNLNPGKLGNFLGKKTYSTGIYEVDGVLYHNICYSVQIPGKWRFYNGSTLKSVDGGANWVNHRGETNIMPPNKETDCMYPDDRWNQVNFVKYGKGGGAPNIDNAETYVYLNSRYKGAYYLARIRREDLPSLDTKKIQYYKGKDGMHNASWTSDISEWLGIAKGQKGRRSPPTTIVYNYGLRRYLSVLFKGDSWCQPPIESSLGILEAPHPWGPWTLILEENVNHKEGDNLAWSYLLQKFTSADGKKMWMTIAGRKPYGLQFMPVYLTTHPVQSYEAETAELTGVTQSRAKEGYTGSGYVRGFDEAGDQCLFRVNIKNAGAYILKIRYNTRKYQSIDFLVNGTLIEKLKLGRSEQVYATWTEMSMFSWLQKGDNTIVCRADTVKEAKDLNLDSLSFAFYSEIPNVLPNCSPTKQR